MKKTKYTVTKNCLNCGKEFTRCRSHAKQTGAKCCSNRCANTGKRSHMWQGQNAGYNAIHKWVQRHKGRATECSQCGVAGKFDGTRWSIKWANKDHKYRRNLDDFIALCARCHKFYDIKYNGSIIRNQSGICQLRSSHESTIRKLRY